ncbi:hypothetical protein XENTR_v10017280 [Xenopus tropicalis]|nr:hypothetical protein XENTR_v10017280 [Xenopus tropicalis]
MRSSHGAWGTREIARISKPKPGCEEGEDLIESPPSVMARPSQIGCRSLQLTLGKKGKPKYNRNLSMPSVYGNVAKSVFHYSMVVTVLPNLALLLLVWG